MILLIVDEVQMFDAGVSPACFHAVTTQLSEVEHAATLQLLVSYKNYLRGKMVTIYWLQSLPFCVVRHDSLNLLTV